MRELFLRIAQKYDKGLSQACEQGELSIRDQLAYLGIYARPELYELAGDAIIHTAEGIKLVQEKISENGLKGAIQWFNEQEV